MSNTCGEIRFMEGGTIKDATILNSQMVNSVISSSTIDSSSVTNLSSIDSASARVIMQAIAALSPSDLRVLIDALLAAMIASSSATQGACLGDSIPATMLGNDDYLLGAPDGWLPISNGVVPVYGSPCGTGGTNVEILPPGSFS